MVKLSLRVGVSARALIAVAALAPSAAFAQSSTTSDDAATSEIVVTAQRRAEALVDVPITVTTLSNEQLSTANVQQLTDISKITPALRFDRQAQFVQPTIRGIGTGITTAGGGSNVGIYVDGFYSPNPGAADFQLLNVQSIQVLKGPQGTLFGRNTTGGAILVQTTDPSTDTSGEARVRYGRYNEINAQGYATFGISEKVAIDVEGGYQRGDGWVRDLSNGGKDGDYRNWSVRLGMKAQMTDDVSVLLRYQHNQVNDPRPELSNAYVDPVLGAGVANYAPPGSFTSDKNAYVPGKDKAFLKSSQDILQLTLQADLGVANLTSYSQYRRENGNESEDLDHIGLTVFQLGLPVKDTTWSQEFLLTSKPGTKLQWTAGLFAFKNTDTYVTLIDNGVSSGASRVRLGGSSAPTYSYAAFVDATYEITPQLFLTAGARYAHDEVKNAYWNTRFTGAKNYVPTVKGDRVTPRFVIRYKPTNDTSLYASYTRGYKAQIIDVGGTCQNAINPMTPSNPTGAGFTCNEVKPETISAYEGGFKFDSRRFSFEGAAYYYDYKNLQVSLFLNSAAAIINAASSKIYGLEGAVHYAITPQFDITAGANYNHGRYTNFPNAPIYRRCPGIAGCGSGTSFFIDTSQTLKDVHMQRSPDFTGNIGATYKTDLAQGELALSGNVYYTSKFFFGPSGVQFPQKGYETVSLRAQWTDPSDRYTLALWGDNVSNSRYVTQVQYNNFGIGSTWNQPVTYGLEVGAKF